MLPGLSGVGGFFNTGIQFVNYASTRDNISNEITATLPTGITSGDLLVAVMTVSDSGTATAETWTTFSPVGWTERRDQNAAPNIRVATKIAGSGETNPVFVPSGTGQIACTILAFRNAAYDTIGTTATSTLNGTITYNDITSAGGFVLAAIASGNDSDANLHVFGAPSGYNAIPMRDSSWGAVQVFYRRVNAGATSGLSSTISGQTGSANNAGVLIGVMEA